jgi:hypothetical membrane protein
VAAPPLRAISIAVTSRRLAWLGLTSVGVLALGTVATAIAYRGAAGEAYSPLNHFISELGEIEVSRLAWAFNLGVVLGGAGLGLFVLVLAQRLGGRPRIALSAAGLAAGAFGAMVGIFPMDYHQTHRIVSELFFLTGWLIPAIFSLWLLTAPRPGLSHWLLAPGAAVVAVSLTFIAVYSTYRPTNPDGPVVGRPAGFWSVPFFEWASLVSIMVWLVCVSVVLLREPSE